MLFSDLTPSQYSRLSKLLDESLDLPHAEREARLGNLAHSEPCIAHSNSSAATGVGLAVAASLILTLVVGLAVSTYEAQVATTQRNAALQVQLRSLTQTADARLHEGDVASEMAIAPEILPSAGTTRRYTPEALNVFQEARAQTPRSCSYPLCSPHSRQTAGGS